MATVLEERSHADLTEKIDEENARSENPGKEHREHDKPNPNHLTERFEVILPIDESEIDQKSLDFAIQTARNFSGKLVLLYISERSHIPAGFLEFANAEGIRDYEWHYYNSLANDRLESIVKRAEAEGIEWTGHVHLGGIESAVKHFDHKKKGILVLNLSKKGGEVAKSLRGLKMSEISKFGVPLLMI
jgi:nucleotide-binding universal stress UspA family protein